MRHADERHATLQEVACERCAAVVKVTKFSPQHTSVQWSADSVRRCAEFADRGPAEGRPGGTPPRTCASLWETIDRAVRDGQLEVRSP